MTFLCVQITMTNATPAFWCNKQPPACSWLNVHRHHCITPNPPRRRSKPGKEVENKERAISALLCLLLIQNLFTPQRPGRVHRSGFYRLEANSHQCDSSRHQTSKSKYPPLHVDLIGKAFQPATHHIPAKWCSDKY